jgi:hypothetical protein
MKKTPPIAAATGGASSVRKTVYSLIVSKCRIMLNCLNATDFLASKKEKNTTHRRCNRWCLISKATPFTL